MAWVVYYLETSCSSEPLWRARRRVPSDRSINITHYGAQYHLPKPRCPVGSRRRSPKSLRDEETTSSTLFVPEVERSLPTLRPSAASLRRASDSFSSTCELSGQHCLEHRFLNSVAVASYHFYVEPPIKFHNEFPRGQNGTIRSP